MSRLIVCFLGWLCFTVCYFLKVLPESTYGQHNKGSTKVVELKSDWAKAAVHFNYVKPEFINARPAPNDISSAHTTIKTQERDAKTTGLASVNNLTGEPPHY